MTNRMYEMFAAGRARGAERRKQGLIAQYVQPALSGDADAQANLLKVDPGVGMQVQGFAGTQRKAALDEVGKLSAVYVKTKDPMIRDRLIRAGQTAGVFPTDSTPDWNNPQDAEGLYKTAEALMQAYGPGEANEQYTLAPGAARYDSQGNLIAERPTAPPRPDYVFQTDAEGNGFWLPKPTGMPPAPTSGAPAPTTGGGGQVLENAVQGATGQAPQQGGDPFASLTASVPGLRVTSRTRTPEENARLPNSVPNSYHLTGQAIDIGRPDPQQRQQIDQWAAQNGFEVIDNYKDGHVHLEPAPGRNAPTRPQPAPGGAIPIPGFRGAPKGKDAPSGYRYAPDGQSLVPIPGGPADRKANPLPSDLAKGEMGLRKEVEGRVKDQRVVVDMYQKVRAASQNPSAPNDLALIFAYMKMLDPGSVVREAEFANAQNAAGVPDQVRNIWNRAQRGERLNDDQRAAFLKSASEIYGVASQNITRQTREYQGMADQYGYDPRRSTGSPDFRQVAGAAGDSVPAGGDVSSMSDDDLLRALGQ